MSIFDLKTNVNELSSSNQGTSKSTYDQQPPTRDITTNNFPNGAIHFRWQTSGQKWWLPNRSYLRLRCQLSRGDGAPLTLSDNIAPNMGLCASLFQSAEFRINDKTVSRVSDFMPQVDALETRLTKSRSWLNGIGNSINFWDDDFKVRQADVASDGFRLENLTEITQVMSAPFSRTELGLDPPGTTATDANGASYVNNTGLITFVKNTTGAALPADMALLYPVGSYFQYTVIQGATGTDPRLKKPALVIAATATTITVAANSFGANVASDGRTDWVRTDLTETGSTNIARKVQNFELNWSPPLSMFKIGHAMPSGKYELILNPQTASVYQKAAIESLLGAGDKDAGLTNITFKFSIVDMYMYINTVEGPRCDDITYLLDLEQTRCQSEKVDTTSFQQKNWDVSPSTYALTVAYQDLRAGTNSQVSSAKFKSYNVALSASEELKLNRFYISYAGSQLPNPDADPAFDTTTDNTTQRYVESQIYSGAFYDSGGAETIQEFHNRGSYYYFSWPRDGTDRSTRVNVHQQFNAADVANMRVLLFDHSKQVARVRVQDGRVIDVQVEDA